MRSITRVVEDLYRGFAAHDAPALLSLLSPTVGHVSAAMLRDVWVPTFTAYDATPVPDTVRLVDDGSVLVHGWYVGSGRSSGEPMRAEFVHLIEVDGEQITALRQITDTASWPLQL